MTELCFLASKEIYKYKVTEYFVSASHLDLQPIPSNTPGQSLSLPLEQVGEGQGKNPGEQQGQTGMGRLTEMGELNWFYSCFALLKQAKQSELSVVLACRFHRDFSV